MGGKIFKSSLVAIAIMFSATAAQALQCVPYARQVSGVSIHGNAWTWWGQAAGEYERGNTPKVGAVMVMKSTKAMPLGHVAAVAKIVDSRTVMLNHANWSRPSMIEKSAKAVDVSPANDWSEVRVWHAPTGTLGLRHNPTYGFIYPK